MTNITYGVELQDEQPIMNFKQAVVTLLDVMPQRVIEGTEEYRERVSMSSLGGELTRLLPPA